jgi:hypothetical protein
VTFIQSVLLSFAALWNGYLEIKVADYKGFPELLGLICEVVVPLVRVALLW